MKLPLTGGCQCGELRYEITAEPLSVYLCHCTDCQRQSGSAFAMSVLVPREALIYTAGHPSKWEKTADSGRKMDGDFCATCGVRIAHHPRANEKVSVLKPGTLDDTSWLSPVGHIWTRSAQPWFPIPRDSIVHEGHPPDLAPFMAAWQRYRQSV